MTIHKTTAYGATNVRVVRKGHQQDVVNTPRAKPDTLNVIHRTALMWILSCRT